MSNTSLSSKSVDPAEVDRFNKLADTWWDAQGPMWPLHTLNQLRIGFIVDQLIEHFGLTSESAAPLQGLRILDIGCGGGLLSEAMAQRGASVHGVDIPEKNIAVARQHAEGMSNPPVYEQTTAEDLQQRSETYDVVLNMEVVEHVADLSSFMGACNALVRTGGVQIISTINRNPIAWVSAILGAEYILRWLPKGTHQYKKLVRPSELNKFLQSDGFRQITTTGVFVNPFTRGMSLRRSRVISYMVVAEKSKAA